MATGTKKLTARQFLNYWFDTKNGKIGIEYTDSRTGLVKKTASFHAVTSGFNEVVTKYYGKTGKEFLEDSVKKELCSIKPVGKGKTGRGIPGVRVYPFSSTQGSNKAESIMAEMGIS